MVYVQGMTFQLLKHILYHIKQYKRIFNPDVYMCHFRTIVFISNIIVYFFINTQINTNMSIKGIGGQVS